MGRQNGTWVGLGLFHVYPYLGQPNPWVQTHGSGKRTHAGSAIFFNALLSLQHKEPFIYSLNSQKSKLVHAIQVLPAFQENDSFSYHKFLLFSTNYGILQKIFKVKTTHGYKFQIWVGLGHDPTQPNPGFAGLGRTHYHPYYGLYNYIYKVKKTRGRPDRHSRALVRLLAVLQQRNR